RCVYHGWKFDAEGNCVDMPNAPEHQDFKHKVKAKVYKSAERNGMVWVYMGDPATAPGLPSLEATLVPEQDVTITFIQRECNWLQALEGEIDTSHFSFLHFGGLAPDDIDADQPGRLNVTNRAPEFKVTETDWGTMYGAWRDTGDNQKYWRVAHFLFPFWAMPPHGAMEDHVWTRAWVPMDDTHTMYVEFSWTGRTAGLRTVKTGETIPGLADPLEYQPNETGWFGRWRLKANESNDYLLNRDAQAVSYTGIPGLYLQDQAITESMGPLVDHGFEQLAPSDLMITQTRRRLLNAARAYRENGELPPNARDPDVYLGARGGDFTVPDGADWLECYEARRKSLLDPTGRLQSLNA
ncbi:MAG: (2Fe-2S)-binding protein, partial [Rhodospirillales bacterium]|nr:(2Fe-2S)-binding protein [Rhodospirillales bacterium]